ncbi:MAG: hypothetical protein AAF447_17675, partial [Myxococcota bacterium]
MKQVIRTKDGERETAALQTAALETAALETAALETAALETAATQLEVIVGWRDDAGDEDVLHAAHLDPGTPFVLGTTAGADLLVPAEVLGAQEVVLIDQEGHVRLPAGATRLSGAAEGVDGAPLMFTLGAFVVRVRSVRAGRRTARGGRVDRAPFAYVGGAMALAATCLTLFALTPPASAAMSVDHLEHRRRLLEAVTLAPAFDEPEPERASAGGGEPGQAHEGESGRMGAEDAPRRDRRAAVAGDARAEDRQLSREQQREQARTSGILGALPTALSGSPIASPFGADQAIGSDPMDALGHLLGDRIGLADGNGGAGILGSGRGAGGDGRGTVGLGDRGLGTIGGCAPGADCRGGRGRYGHTTGLPARGRESRVPTIGGRVESLAGSLSRDAIRRTIRRHRNEVKFCYEQ